MELFPNFLKDESVYDQAVNYWDKMCQVIFKKYRVENEWETWFSARYLNGTPKRDANPIISQVNNKEKKGIRIIQSDEPIRPIIAYMDIFDQEVANITHIVISCFLTDETSQKAKELIDCWVSRKYNKDEMEIKIEEITEKTKW